MTGIANNAIRVLYVEDERTLRDVVSDYLEAIGGFQVNCAQNGEEGIALANEWKPHFILMDIRMPVMDGIEAIRILRSRSETENLPIYVLTAYSDEKTLAECEEAGADGYFTKPPNYSSIIFTIKEEIEKRTEDEPDQ